MSVKKAPGIKVQKSRGRWEVPALSLPVVTGRRAVEWDDIQKTRKNSGHLTGDVKFSPATAPCGQGRYYLKLLKRSFVNRSYRGKGWQGHER